MMPRSPAQPSPHLASLPRGSWIALGLLLAVLAFVIALATRTIREDRAELVTQFSNERQDQVDEAARIVRDDLEDIARHLRLAGELVHDTESPRERERELRALLARRELHAINVYDTAARTLASAVDPQSSIHTEAFAGTMTDAARRALTSATRALEVTLPLEHASGRRFRVFAASIGAGSEARAVAMLVETGQLFEKLKLVTAEPSSRLLVLGPVGTPSATSDPILARLVRRVDDDPAVRAAMPRLALLLARMRDGQRGTFQLGETEAHELGFEAAELIAAIAPIVPEGQARWSVATLSSTAALRAHERTIVGRLALAFGTAGVSLLAFGAYLVLASRRALVVRERLRHAEELARVHERTDKMLDHMPTGVVALTADGKLALLNRALRERLPSPPALGADLAEAFPEAPPAVVRRLRALIQSAVASGRVRSLHGERVALFGEEAQFNIHAVPLDPVPDGASSLLAIEDLSQVESLESQLLRAEKLATVGVLAAGIAHEVGTPLGVVRGRAEYVQGKLGAKHPQAEGLRVIIEQIDRVTRTIRELLDFSRVKPPAVRPVALRPVAAAVAELLRFETTKRKVSFQANVPDGLPPLAADPDQLQQVLVNLIMNSCDACSAGGHVMLTAQAEPEGGAEPWPRLRLEVADDGCGIPAESQHQVFDPFFTTKKRGQGTGLGLAIVAQIVRNHGGQIELESAFGAGTRVRILWPAAASSTLGAA